MRIVAGALRGRTLVAPKGHSTRPTADRTREALFNVLEHAPWSPGLQGRRVIDLFAGSGALGLEALSRGAAFCRFVDSDDAARDAIAHNLATLKLGPRAEVADNAFALAAPRERGTFDLAFLDPPYGRGLAEPALSHLADGAWLAKGALAVVELGAGEGRIEAVGYGILDVRAWGAARVCFLRALGTGRGSSR
ncbi:MAG: 16S rRNA (guanine(966)-N(2))-methyltransferase RsmD [Caulobacteraceae bacterium]|nr:16S rRNA (guanine(966)-N(2))-methyltransferase RsmD [Caulobacteraceae bacterium]